MTLDIGLIVVALGNVGAVGIVGKFLLKGVEKSNENLPVILDTIATHSKAIEKLLDVSGETVTRVSAMELLHKLKKCEDLSDMKVKRKEP